MTSNSFSPEVYRVIDANLNRLREGVRVVEDLLRYKYNNKELSTKLKSVRHKARVGEIKKLLEHRDSINDVLKISTQSEKNRKDILSILTANFKRAEESARVLEEIYKLQNTKDSENFKNIRYELYDLEKITILNIL